MSSERGGLITKLVLLIVVLAVVAYDAGSVLVARVQVDDIAEDAAVEAAAVFAHTGSTEKAKAASSRIAEQRGTELAAFGIDRVAKKVHVTVRKRAKTLIIHRVGPTRKYVVADGRRDRSLS